MKAKDLRFAEYNPRKIEPQRLEMLGQSMHTFGDISCIVWNEATQRLIAGHQRLKHIPPDAEIIWTEQFDQPDAQETTGWGYIDAAGERWLVRRVHVTDEAREVAMNIAANKHGGEFDFVPLSELLSELDAHGFDMSLTGFENAELESLLASWSAESAEGGFDALGSAKGPLEQMTFTLTATQATMVRDALRRAGEQGEYGDTGNDNGNGNALARVAEAYVVR